jgi:hypothetical protein
MSTRIRRTLVCACLTALAVPAAAGAAPVEVDPPGARGEGAFSTAARDPGCSARNIIGFREDQGQARSRVRHAGVIRCTRINVRIVCSANLFRGTTRISQLRSRGSDSCSIGSAFSESNRYPDGSRFTQKYRYELTLRNDRKRWSGTTRKCPKRSKDRRTLVCKASHSTTSPNRSVETIRS